MSQGQGLVWSGVGRSSGTARWKTVLSLVLAACVAMASFLLAGAEAAVPVQANNFGGEGTGAGSFRAPGGVAISPDGSTVFVADTGNNRIDEFTAEGRFLRAWGWGVKDGTSKLQTCTEETECLAGQAGQGAGQLNEPVGVAVGSGGVVYAVNRAKGDGRVLKFSTSGKTVTAAGALPAGYGKDGAGKAGFSYPLPAANDIAVGPAGQVYVPDNGGGSPRVVIFEAGGEINKFEVALSEISAIAVAPGGRVYLSNGNMIDVYGAKGGLIEEIRTQVYSGITALAVEPGSENLLVEPPASEQNFHLIELTGAGKEVRTIPVPEMTRTNQSPYAFGLAVDPTVQFTEPPSEPGAIYVVDRAGNQVRVLAEPTPGEAAIEGVSAEDVGPDGATLSASVNPKGNDTHAYFEYGATTAYGFAAPAAPGYDLGGGFTAKPLSTHLYGLQPNTTYHYALVVTSSAGTETSADRTFTTFPIGGPFSLPDERAYELVTTENGTHNVGGLFGSFAAPGGNGVAFGSAGPLPGSSTGALNSAYVALRGPEGWRTEGATPPVEDSLGSNFLVSADLSQSVGISEANLTGNAPAGNKLYLRDNATGAETLMTPYLPAAPYREYNVYGVSADFRHILFTSNARLTPQTPAGEGRWLYEYSGGSLKNVGILPGATAPTGSIGSLTFTHPSYPVSEDGSKVIFTAEPGEGKADQVFVRTADTATVEASASQAKVPDPEAAEEAATFDGAAANGSAVFFTSNARLTDDAFTGSDPGTGEPKDQAPNLYRYEVATGKLVDLTVSTDPADEELGAAVTGGVLVDADGNGVYFVAKGDLAAGATSGKPNLYHWTQGVGTTFVATLGESDLLSSGPASFGEPATAHARTTADGSVLAFTSNTPLDPAFPRFEEREIYRYAAATGAIECVSCARSETTVKPAQINEAPNTSAGYGGNVLSTDGSRIFFQTTAALVPGDTNGRTDVYEWENGAAHLISTGTGTGASLLDASASGNDVFFTTEDQLIPADQNHYVDIYDARVHGGLPSLSVASPPCEGEACLPPTEAKPSTGTVGSRAFDGPGNHKKARHHHKKHKRHHKHRKHVKHRKQKRSHGHPAVGKRG